MKGICGVFRVEEGSSSSYSRPRENKVETPRDTRRVSTDAIYSGAGIKVGTITRERSKEDTIKIGTSKLLLEKREGS
ncbi:hypothetical protein KY289_008240 [Solanum tuberosum]|nr:hypothetical protein KY289_008240 [Solanum tuberosum]